MKRILKFNWEKIKMLKSLPGRIWTGLAARLNMGNDGGIKEPGLRSKTVAKGIIEHRHKKGGRTYIRKINETTFEVVARSGKRTSDQNAVIKRLQKIYN